VGVNSINSQNQKPGNGHNSIYSLEICEQYISFCQSRDGNIKSVEAVAAKIYQTGLSDLKIEKFLEAENKPPAVKKAEIQKKIDCPRCFGSGMEFRYSETGEQLGVIPNCRHLPLLPGEWLFEWKSEEVSLTE
jgi:hypothetical protein